jgi:hypothetical protein
MKNPLYYVRGNIFNVPYTTPRWVRCVGSAAADHANFCVYHRLQNMKEKPSLGCSVKSNRNMGKGLSGFCQFNPVLLPDRLPCQMKSRDLLWWIDRATSYHDRRVLLRRDSRRCTISSGRRQGSPASSVGNPHQFFFSKGANETASIDCVCMFHQHKPVLTPFACTSLWCWPQTLSQV